MKGCDLIRTEFFSLSNDENSEKIFVGNFSPKKILKKFQFFFLIDFSKEMVRSDKFVE